MTEPTIEAVWISVSMPRELRDRLDRLALQTDRSRSGMIRHLLIQALMLQLDHEAPEYYTAYEKET